MLGFALSYSARQPMIPIFPNLSSGSNVLGFLIGLPIAIATYYQAWRIRHESRLARQGLVFSENCLDFILPDGTSINLVPLETLHSLPKPGDIVFLPGSAVSGAAAIAPGAYRIIRVEHIYATVESPHARQNQARLAKATAEVEPLNSQARPAPTRPPA